MAKDLTLTFEIEHGVITLDVLNGDGTNCENLAAVLLRGSEVLEMTKKPEYRKKGHTVGASQRTT